MKLYSARGTLLALLMLGAAQHAQAQSSPAGSPSLLPLPDARSVGQDIRPVAYRPAAPVATNSGYRTSLAASQADTSAFESVPSGPATPAAGGANPWQGYLSGDTQQSTAPVDPSGGMTCGSSSCASGCAGCAAPCCGQWFGSIGGLVMTRNNPNAYWTSYQTNNNPNQVLNTKQTDQGWVGGGQVSVGRWFCPPCCDPCGGSGGGWGIQFTYWQLGDMNGYTSVNSLQLFGIDSNLSTPMDVGSVNITNGAGTNPAGAFFDNASEHRIWRTDRFSNFELNVLHQQLYTAPGRCNISCLAGFRYINFQDILTFGSVAGGFQFGQAGGIHEAYLQSNVTNNLFGGQIGVMANYAITPRFGVFATPKIGIMGNSMNATNRLYTGDNFTTFNIHAHKNDVALLGELDLGTYWQICNNVRLYGGWRVLGISQVALADNQFLPFLADAQGFNNVKSNGDLILTGAFAGLAFTF